MTTARFRPWTLLALAAGIVAFGCAAGRPPPATAAGPGPIRVFDFVALDGQRFASETTRGRLTVVIFVTTFDIASQYTARELGRLVSSHRPRINAGAVVLEPPRNQPLVEAFAATLALPFPVAMSDAGTLAKSGPFEPIDGVPTVVVLDRSGREVWRRSRAASAADIEAALRAAPP